MISFMYDNSNLMIRNLKELLRINYGTKNKPSRGGADFDQFVQKGGFGSLR